MQPFRGKQNFQNLHNFERNGVLKNFALIGKGKENIAFASDFYQQNCTEMKPTSDAYMYNPQRETSFFDFGFSQENVFNVSKGSYNPSNFSFNTFDEFEKDKTLPPGIHQTESNTFKGIDYMQNEVHDYFADEFTIPKCYETNSYSSFLPKKTIRETKKRYNHFHDPSELMAENSKLVAQNNKKILYFPKITSTESKKKKLEDSSCFEVISKKMKSESSNKCATYTPKTGQSYHSFVNRRTTLLRVVTGSVDKVLSWWKLRENFQVLYEVVATLGDLRPGKIKTEKLLLLRDSEIGPTLQVVFYEIDRSLEKLRIGCNVTCFGKLINRNRLQAYKVTEITEEDKSQLINLGFICDRVAQEAIIFSSRNKEK